VVLNYFFLKLDAPLDTNLWRFKRQNGDKCFSLVQDTHHDIMVIFEEFLIFWCGALRYTIILWSSSRIGLSIEEEDIVRIRSIKWDGNWFEIRASLSYELFVPRIFNRDGKSNDYIYKKGFMLKRGEVLKQDSLHGF